jgi:RimJ/RimL family protein N-acetyltransferase
VLKRFYDSLIEFNLNDEDIIVRLTGDCPLHDATVIDESINAFIKDNCDYLANCIKPIYPDGLDVEVFNYKSLKLAFENASLKSELEHVTPYIRKSKQLKIKNLDKEAIYPTWRLTVDEKNDFKLITKIYENFKTTYFSLKDIIEFLKRNQDLLQLNKNINRNEGYLKSLKEESMLKGKQVYLRELEFSDINNNYLNWMNSKIVNQYMETRFKKQTIDTIQQFVKNIKNDITSEIFAICDLKTKKHIGNIKLGPINSIHKKADISFFIGEVNYWGKGYITEAIKLIVNYGFDIKKLHKITAGAYEDNIGSIFALEKNNFKIECIKKEEILFNNKWSNLVLLGKINDK